MLCFSGSFSAAGRQNLFRLKGNKLSIYTTGAAGGSTVTAEVSFDNGSTWTVLGTITIGTAFQVPDICTDTTQTGIRVAINATGGVPVFNFAVYDNR